MKRFLFAVAALFLALAPASAEIEKLAVTGPNPERTVIVVLFDGFAPAMLDATRPTPNFDRLKREGAWSRHLVPAFPSLSLINHTTFATGCWPAHHGIVSNTFRDPKLGWFAAPNDRDDAVWRTGCEYMWEVAARQGVRSAVFNFVGRWNGKRKLAVNVNDEVKWEDHEEDETIMRRAFAALADKRRDHARLIVLYFDFPDHFAHGNGVRGSKTLDSVRRADTIVGRLLAALKSLPAGREGTLVVGTDHGMRDATGIINVTRLMNKHSIQGSAAVDGASTFLYLDKDESPARVAEALSGYGTAFNVYRTGLYPAFARLGTGPRVGDVMLVARPPYRMVDADDLPWSATLLGANWFWNPVQDLGPGVVPSTHGYDPKVPEMHGIFYIWGAGATPGEIKRLDQIDVHPTVMKLLGLQPGRPVDGHPIAAVH